MSDLQGAYRSLRATPMLSATALACLAVGIGATTAIFSVFHAVLLRPIPFDNPDRLVQVWASYDWQGGDDTKYFLTPGHFTELRLRNVTLEGLAASQTDPMRLGSLDGPIRIQGARVSASLFSTMGLRPILGRVFRPEEDRAGTRVVVLSEGLWARQFGSAPNVVGRSVMVEGESHVVLGVLPASSLYPDGADVWVPLAIDDMRGVLLQRGSLSVVARLREGATVQTARQDVESAAADIARTLGGRSTGLGFGTETLQENLVGETRPALRLLFAAVMFLFAIAMVNVANLLLVRARAEAPRHALRMALGAGPVRIARYIMIENLLLATVGGILGLGLVLVGTPIILARQPEDLIPFGGVQIDIGVLLFTLGTTLASALALGTLLAIKQIRTRPATLLAESSVRTGPGRRGRRVMGILGAVEVATAVVLLVGASLMIKSLSHLRHTSPGFETSSALIARVAAPTAMATTHEGRVSFYLRVLEQVGSLPGLTNAGATHALPVTDITWSMGFSVLGQPPEIEGQRENAVFRLVTPGYFGAMTIPLLAGRTFLDSDRSDNPPVVIVSRQLADHYWPGENPIGKRLKRGTYDQADEPWREVIGVVGDVQHQGAREEQLAALYFPHQQLSRGYGANMTVVAKTSGNPAALAGSIRTAIRSLDEDAMVYEVTTLSELVRGSLARDRFHAFLLTIFAALGVFLAGAGIYGVVSYGVNQRRGELSLRQALGADAQRVVRVVLAGVVRIAVIGVVVGVGAALVLTRFMTSLLFGVSAVDTASYVTVSIGLTAVTLLAGFVPAWRATQVDPVQALRGK